MAFRIQCRLCRTDTWAGNISDLIDLNTDERGRLVCAMCGASECYIHRITSPWEKEPDETWDGYIKGIIRVATKTATYAPYVLLTADSPDGEVSGIRLSSYHDPRRNGKLTDGPGPGGAPFLTQNELLHLLDRLSAYGVIKSRDLEVLGTRFRRDSLSYSCV